MKIPLDLNKGGIIIVFDGYCVLCNRFVKWLAKRDNAQTLYFTTFESKYIKQYFPRMIMGDTVIVLNSAGKQLIKSKAVMACLSAIDYNPALTKCLGIIPTKIADIVYAFVAKTRYLLFGKKQHCTIPEGIIAKRVLE